MKVYYHGKSTKHTLMVQPAVDYPEVSTWYEGGAKKMFQITFLNSVADIEDNLAQYLIEKGLASKSPIILPKEAA